MTTKQGAIAENPTTQSLRFIVSEVTCDPVQYKPYMPKLSPECLVLELEVPTDLVKDYEPEDDVMVVGLEGFKYVLTQLADAVDEMNHDRVIKNSKARN